MKQLIVDHNPSVSGRALVSSLHLCAAYEDVVKKWAINRRDDNIV
jgi:hypothetical protein